MKIDINDICIDLKKIKKFDDEIEFFKQNYNKIHMNKYFYESWEELKIDVDFSVIVFIKNFYVILMNVCMYVHK
jgi:hypothetical protein